LYLEKLGSTTWNKGATLGEEGSKKFKKPQPYVTIAFFSE
jgi:hypothetical protein